MLIIQLILILVLICQKLSREIIVKNVKKKRKNCNTKVLPTEYDDDDFLQSYNDQHTNNEVSEEKDLRISKSKNILELEHSEENKTDQLESEELILSKKTQKEGDADDLVDTNTGTDTGMSETYKRDHSEEFEEKKVKTCNTKK